jgi:hypothetical protein
MPGNWAKSCGKGESHHRMEQEGQMTPEQIAELKRIVLQGNIEEFEAHAALVDILDDYERLRANLKYAEAMKRQWRSQWCDLKAELERARPLLEAVENTAEQDLKDDIHFMECPMVFESISILRKALEYQKRSKT